MKPFTKLKKKCTMQSSIESRWNISRTVFLVYLGVFCLVFSTYYLYQHSVRYIQSYDYDNQTPGVFYSQIWNWDFAMQGIYSIIIGPYFFLAFLMFVRWFEKAPFYIFAVVSLFAWVCFIGFVVYLSIQLGRANTCASVGNPFNDFRICGVCGQYQAWSSQCFGVAPYNPPVIGGLQVNGPKAFQYGYTWAYVILFTFGFFYTISYYIKSQNAYIEALTGSVSMIRQDTPKKTDEFIPTKRQNVFRDPEAGDSPDMDPELAGREYHLMNYHRKNNYIK